VTRFFLRGSWEVQEQLHNVPGRFFAHRALARFFASAQPRLDAALVEDVATAQGGNVAPEGVEADAASRRHSRRLKAEMSADWAANNSICSKYSASFPQFEKVQVLLSNFSWIGCCKKNRKQPIGG
jgi:hypothetical protein